LDAFPLTARDSLATLPGIIGCGGDGEKVSVRHFSYAYYHKHRRCLYVKRCFAALSRSTRPCANSVKNHSITLHRRMGSTTTRSSECGHTGPPPEVFLRHITGPPVDRGDAPVPEYEPRALQPYRSRGQGHLPGR